ncbi:hypothetical protein M9H77_30488 [Catharanthus roseus]|uniref:Uncharacterized protein n=1 Tax=Catharanthus roseus TaxID=4058 RepID=A0ACB9ZYB0_CATRO|nr:hypothetical protein M9H77_30488 [Catharanthus roseus]
MDYGELLGIIEEYETGSSISGLLTVESDSLRAVKCLNSHKEDISELGAFVTYFLDIVCPISTSFSHVCEPGNSPTHLLAKIALNTAIPLAWTRNIPSHVAHAILFYINNI